MNSDVLYLVFFVVLIIALLAYINIKEREAGVKFSKLQNELEDLQRQLHYVKKEREAAGAENAAGEVGVGGAGDEDYALALIKEELKIELERDLSTRMAPVLSSIKIIENLIDQFQDEQQSRLLKLEQQTQSMTKLRPNFENEEERIIVLFNEGKSIEQIAKDLRIGTGNVELVLKFKKLIK